MSFGEWGIGGGGEERERERGVYEKEGGKYACKKRRKGPLVLSGRMRLIEGLTFGRVRKLNVGEGILFNRMRTLAGDSCPSARLHIILLCVLDMGACTCSMHNVHPSLVLVGGLLHILFTWMRILWPLHHLSRLKVKNRWQSFFSFSIFQLFCHVISTNTLPVSIAANNWAHYERINCIMTKKKKKTIMFQTLESSANKKKKKLTWCSISSAISLVRFHYSEHLTLQHRAPTPTRDGVLPEMSASELLVLPSWAKAIIPRPSHQQPRRYRERQPSNCHQTFLLSARSPSTGVGGVRRSLPTPSPHRTRSSRSKAPPLETIHWGDLFDSFFTSGLFLLPGRTISCSQPMSLRGLDL